MDAFQRYQLEQAWIWELQALTRARPVAGSAEMSKSFMTIRHRVLTKSRDKEFIRHEIQDMRKRIRTEHANGEPLKHNPGGILDIEFVVQLGLLTTADRFPGVIESTKVTRQLWALFDHGWINTNAFSMLSKAYSQLSDARLRASLIDDELLTETDSALKSTRAFCNELLG
jgi:glutamate-ammonia-ligase adenylyltransferase